MRIAVAVLFCVWAASPALAQTYVAGLVGADAVRSTGVEVPNPSIPSADGEAVSGNVRAGTSLGERWGVELEIARNARIERELTFRPPSILLGFDVVPIPVPTPQIFPPISIEYRSRVRAQHTAISPVLWVAQALSGSVDLAYVGGLAFTRTVSTVDLTVVRGLPSFLPPLTQMTRRTLYDVKPVAGIELRLGLTEHLRLIAGTRIQGLKSNTGDAWAVRTAAGLGWIF